MSKKKYNAAFNKFGLKTQEERDILNNKFQYSSFGYSDNKEKDNSKESFYDNSSLQQLI